MSRNERKTKRPTRRYVGFVIPQEDYEWIRLVASKEDRPLSAVLRRIIKKAREQGQAA